MKWVFLSINNSVAICAGAWLISIGHPWWGVICFLLVASVTVTTSTKK